MKTLLLSQLADCSQDTISITIDDRMPYRIFNDSPDFNQAITVHLADYAHCEWIDVRMNTKEVTSISYTAIVGTYSELSHTLICLGNKKTMITINAILDGQKSNALFYGLYGLKEDDAIQITTNQHHKVPDATSSLIYKGILADASQVDFNGMITIEQNAVKSCAAQYNKNMLLSNRAKAISVPSLQVLTNDVSCKHGSATGKWDEQQLWYLQSRGLCKQQAQQLLLKAFINDAFHGITDDAICHTVSNGMNNLFFPKLS